MKLLLQETGIKVIRNIQSIVQTLNAKLLPYKEKKEK